MFRIIGGKHKNLRIKAPSNLPARPTTDRSKESIINIVNNYFDFETMDFLDLFSGTGNMSYEFSSRECHSVVAVETHAPSVSFIRETANKLEMKNITVVRGDVFHFLLNPFKQFDLIYADPPYESEDIIRLPELIFSQSWLKPGGWFILEHPKNIEFSSHPLLADTRKYGRTLLSIFKNPM